MTEEEKKARDILVNEIADILIGEYCKQCKICDNENIECYYSKAIDTIDNLIKRQQKEIENLNLCLDCEEKASEGLREDIKSLLQIEPNDNFISKDKIRELLKKYEKTNIEDYQAIIRFYKDLEELLEE